MKLKSRWVSSRDLQDSLRKRGHVSFLKQAVACAVRSEPLERRRLLSTTSFTIVPAQSTLSLGVKATLDGVSVQLTSQGASSINASENSLTTHFSGTLLANVGAGTLQFVSGSSINAEINGNWKPGDDPGASGNSTTAIAADFGGVGSFPLVGTDYVAARNVVFDESSPVIQISNGAYPVAGALTVTGTQGEVYYDGVSQATGTTDIAGETDTDETSSSATLQTVGQTETLTVPIKAVYTQVVSSITVTSTYTGTFVATATIIQPSPTYYLRLDPDAQHIDLWDNSTGTGTVVQQFLSSQTSNLSLTTTGGTGSITIDDSAGDVIPPGGLTLTGDSSTALKLIGSGNGDTVSLNASQLVFNSVPINFTEMTQTTLDPNGGTDLLSVDAGTLILAAPSAGAGLTVRKFSSISIAAGAELQVASPAPHTSRALIVASSLSIAGSTGNWTGTLDLTGNDLDLPGASLSTVTNQIAQGYNAAGGGLWNGTGLISSTAAADTTHLTALGVIQNNQSGSALFTSANPFDGTTPGVSDILVKYTYFGDANLDGKVDGTDYSRIDNGSLNHLTGWFNGDFNYDGVINGSDYTLIDNAYNTQGASLAASIAVPAAGVGGRVGRAAQGAAAVFSQLEIQAQGASGPSEWPGAGDAVAARIFASAAGDAGVGSADQFRRTGSHRWRLAGLLDA